MDIPKFTKAERENIQEDAPEGFELIDPEMFIGMDNHGVNVNLAVVKRESDGQLFGVPWGYSSEETFVGGWDDAEKLHEWYPLIPLQEKVIEVTTYIKEDGSDVVEGDIRSL